MDDLKPMAVKRPKQCLAGHSAVHGGGTTAGREREREKEARGRERAMGWRRRKR